MISKSAAYTEWKSPCYRDETLFLAHGHSAWTKTSQSLQKPMLTKLSVCAHPMGQCIQRNILQQRNTHRVVQTKIDLPTVDGRKLALPNTTNTPTFIIVWFLNAARFPQSPVAQGNFVAPLEFGRTSNWDLSVMAP